MVVAQLSEVGGNSHKICEAERYISINFAKDLRSPIAAERRDDFGGTPSIEVEF
jgi:hypothetical protein